MLIIKANQRNSLVVTVSQNSELINPEYLFSFTHIFTKRQVRFIPTDISTHKSRYDEFEFIEGTGSGQIDFGYEGQWLYSIWEQPAGSGNLNPALAYNQVENGLATVYVASAMTDESNFDFFVSPDEDNSNYIFAPDELNPAPAPSVTPTNTSTTTPTPTITPTVTTTVTPTITTSVTPSVTPTTTNTPTPSITPTLTPSITPTLTPSPSAVIINPSTIFSNLYDWWSSDYGTTVTSGKLDTWDSHSGRTMIYRVGASTTEKASYNSSDSDFNNNPSILLNPNKATGDYGYVYYLPSAPSIGNKTYLAVGKVLDNSLAEGALITYGIGAGNDQRMTIFGRPSADYYIYQNPNIATVGNQYTSNSLQFLRMSYNNSTGITDFFISNTNTFTNSVGTITTSTNYQFGDAISIGFYNNVYGNSPNMKFVELIIIDGIPTNSELTQYSNYLTSKYGL